MKDYFKNKIIIYGVFLIIVGIIALTYALLLYYKVISSDAKSFNIVTFIIGGISFFILGILSGKTANKNGLLEGMIAALIIILLALIINLFVKVRFEGSSFIKIGTYLVSSCLGGVIGVNIKNKE